MTNKSRSHCVVTGSLHYVDLSFDGRRLAKSAGINNGIRPHGGRRGSHTLPPSPLDLKRERQEYNKLQRDIDTLINDIYTSPECSPSWVFPVAKQRTHNGEHPLYANHFLSSRRSDRPGHPHPTPRSTRRTTRPKSGQYYRPNSTHQFLEATDLKDVTADESLKYGRPTRTTLLRAKSRGSSAPVNAYEVRRQMRLLEEEQRGTRQPVTPKEIQKMYSEDSIHSFLTGARYNRAHYVDSKVLEVYGVYMPRDNLQGCFSTHSVTNLIHELEDPITPRASPDIIDRPTHPRISSAPIHHQTSSPRDMLSHGTPTTPSPNATSPRVLQNAWTGVRVSTEQDLDVDPDRTTAVIEELNLWPEQKDFRPFHRTPAATRTKRVVNIMKPPVLPSVQGVSLYKRKPQHPGFIPTSTHIATTGTTDMVPQNHDGRPLEDCFQTREYPYKLSPPPLVSIGVEQAPITKKMDVQPNKVLNPTETSQLETEGVSSMEQFCHALMSGSMPISTEPSNFRNRKVYGVDPSSAQDVEVEPTPVIHVVEPTPVEPTPVIQVVEPTADAHVEQDVEILPAESQEDVAMTKSRTIEVSQSEKLDIITEEIVSENVNDEMEGTEKTEPQTNVEEKDVLFFITEKENEEQEDSSDKDKIQDELPSDTHSPINSPVNSELGMDDTRISDPDDEESEIPFISVEVSSRG